MPIIAALKTMRRRQFTFFSIALEHCEFYSFGILKASVRRCGRSMTTTRNSVMRAAATQPAALFAFDILWLDGRHMRDRPLIERKATLQRTIPPARRIMYLTHVEEHRRGLYEQVSQLSVQR